jgi:hypothetical protein
MMNAVRTAEKRPACKHINTNTKMSGRFQTYKYEECVEIFIPGRDEGFVILGSL